MKYPETVVDSYVREYTGTDPITEEASRNKNATLESLKTPLPAPKP
jgi:hypothetical protein